MYNNNNFYNEIGYEKANRPFVIIGLIITSVVISLLLKLTGLSFAFILLVMPFTIVFLNRIFVKPQIGLIFAFCLNFFLMGLFRYINLSLGYVMDSLLILIYITIFFKNFYTKIDWSGLNNDLIYLTLIWMGYVLFELVNPEATSVAAWVSAMRGESLYMMLLIPLIYLIFNKPKQLDIFLYIWGIFTILATLKGAQQLLIAPDPFEQKWLDNGAASTHVLFGKLRVFSFFTDAGQFGASQGHGGLVGSILFLHTKNFKKKIFWLIVAITGFYGMFISGTRGAIAVPAAGFVLYILLRKNIKIIIAGGILIIGVFVFFKYTTIGNNNYQINRMRTAFDTKDASLNVRLNNQILFGNYLRTRPFGVGIGHAGTRAQKYVPYSYLANIATDSWFVMIWAENGIVGLYLHMFVLFYIIGKGSYIIMFRIKDKELIGKLSALLCGIFGIIGSSYGNMVLGQFPTHLLCYASMAYVFLGLSIEKQINIDNQLKIKK